MHIYNSTSTLQRDVVFHMDREEIKQIAIDGVDMVKKYMKDYDGKVILEYSPESLDRKSTRLNSSHNLRSRMPSSA